MSEKLQSASVVEKVAAETISERKNIAEVLEWGKQNPERLATLLASFDDIIERFNAELSQEILEELVNLTALKAAFGEKRLPTQTELGENASTFIAFVRAMKTMNEMMERGETKRKEGVPLVFHTTETDPETLAVGALFHGYEELLKRDPQRGTLFEHDQLVNGLIEALSQDPANPLFGAVFGKEKLNWVDGYSGFSEKFRKDAGLS